MSNLSNKDGATSSVQGAPLSAEFSTRHIDNPGQRRRGLKTASAFVALNLCAALTATPSFAQQNEDIEEVVVTGSRLNVNPNLNAANPVVTIDAEEIDIRGAVRIEDVTNILPQVFAGQTSEVSNAATGTATLNLRGLGAERTLVLVDGRRLPYGSSVIAVPNLDLIPTQLIERVDVLTGGASAVYGSDAVAGVTNFILKNDFEGIDFEIQGAAAQNGNGSDTFEAVLAAGDQPIPGGSFDGEELFLSLTLGANTSDGRGNVTLFGSYETRSEITQDNRDISACALGSDDGPSSFGGFGCVGSGNFRLFGGPGVQGGALGDGVTAAFQEEDGTIVPFVGGPTQTFNFGPFNFFQRPSERFQIYARGHYDIADNVEVFADLSFTSNTSDAQIAPTASFGTGAFSINCDNPLIQDPTGPTGAAPSLAAVFGCGADDIAAGTVIDGITASHRNVEGGPRNSFLENQAFRFVTGFRGTFAENWDFELFGQFASTDDLAISTNDFIVANVQQAFFAVDDGNGNVVCQDQSGGCIPFNIFQRNADGSSLITQDQLDFIQGVGVETGETQQIVVGGNVQAALTDYGIQSPFSDADIGVLVGFEWREDSLQATPDEISQIPGGGFTGVGGATLPVSGEVNVLEFFAELEVPIVTDRAFAKELTFNGQYRYSDYEANGNGVTNNFDTNTFGFKLSWAPVDDVRFRAQFQRAVRAPNVIELFEGQDQGLPNLDSAGTNANGVGLFDPCASNAPIATLEQCAFTGVTPEQFGSILDVIAGQTQSITGGNPLLDPESSDTYTVGGVFTPSAVPGLSISIDYFNISVDDFIEEGIAAQITLDNCLATGDEAFCGLITRSASGSLAAGGPGFGFQSTNINIADLETTGIDFQVLYGLDFENLGSVSFDYVSTYLASFDFIPFPGGDAIECAGFFSNSCQNPVNPTYRHRLVSTWNTPWNITAAVTWRFFSGTDNLSDTAPDVDARLDTQNYIDLNVNYNVTPTTNVRFGAVNLFNNRAPVSVSAGPPEGNGNTFPGIFDTGRFMFIGFDVSL